jgi:2-C-methyl-D-erythritol 4-phosphate cytidylyltransferase
MISAIIVAAGSGTRMGGKIDKLFLSLAGQPVVAHAWRRFDNAPLVDEVVVVTREEQQASFTELAKLYCFQKPHRIVPGGKERQDSVWNGLQALSPSAELVAIHDGARPCPSPALIETTIEAARRNGAAVAAQRMTDTVKVSEDGLLIEQHLDRSKLWSVQTPQCFRVEIIKRALSLVRERGLRVTDDTAACDLIGQPVMLVESNAPNPKVTLPGDLPYIESLLAGEQAR